ncbi:hypothetical protein DSO57_1036239 [Entomophthora muscae]|uniref:Uncharacterized protein n=1 Tax=Entomophthora muscae TaxID=34485 RepID=A0ACC2U9E1_9FUNG|nr:hypothetical protein DSO57_1036239 [Entomophthora muscae]
METKTAIIQIQSEINLAPNSLVGSSHFLPIQAGDQQAPCSSQNVHLSYVTFHTIIKTSSSFQKSWVTVTSDKLLSTMLIERPQLRDSNPGSLRAASLQGQLPGCPQFFGLEPEQDLTSENPLKLGKSNSPTSIPPTPKDPDNSTNQQAGPATDPRITWAHAEGKPENLPIECRPPRDNQSHNLTRKVEHSQFKPANGITPAIDATKDWEDLVNGKTRDKEICESLRLAILHPTPVYPKKPWTSRQTFTVHQELPLAQYISPSTHPPSLAYSEFTLEEILIHNPKARTRETEVLYREGTKIIWPPLLFRDKYNFRPAYLVPMTPPHTLRPNRPQESVATNESTSIQIFGVMYITLTGLIDFMVPMSRPWAVLGKLVSYIVKLAPILWWALPAGPTGRPPTSSLEPPTGWIPDTNSTNTAQLHHWYHQKVFHHTPPLFKFSQLPVPTPTNRYTIGPKSRLPLHWALYTLEAKIPEGCFLHKNTVSWWPS